MIIFGFKIEPKYQKKREDDRCDLWVATIEVSAVVFRTTAFFPTASAAAVFCAAADAVVSAV